ncbi:L,D-transpeptidase family protein [Curvibacter sp. CHRR-16]|uniref:L,D-transpeptidase family protein n=1 Tax=Curvibacter sp. CHRR-16 TaxID=2835872 RepID=UPI001BDB5530|nr:L,D-transpeptidase family protein [Curvibacter sp. CHRR-16]MBT0571100.1 L,D-transpeptidase family protein [Curvibacter sp. CHRR-16]
MSFFRILHGVALATFLLCANAHSASVKQAKAPPNHAQATPVSNTVREDGKAEAHLIQVLQLIGKADMDNALGQAEKMVRQWPHFQLGQLVYGDLLMAKVRPLQKLGDMPTPVQAESQTALNNLREESQRRIRALRERPPQGAVPVQFLRLAPSIKHAIAVDASRSRLYLFKNSSTGLELISDYYISVGKAGIDKSVEGDQRTPLGVYFITSYLDPKSLKDFYGAGALPINYPNALDLKRGKTGGGIWLHGTPPTQFSRAPKASDGCVVLANPDLTRIIQTVETRTTPVLITPEIQWVKPDADKTTLQHFETTLLQWRSAKASGDMSALMSFYAQDFKNNTSKDLGTWKDSLKKEVSKTGGRSIELKEASFMRWKDRDDIMIANFDEINEGTRSSQKKRQYWIRDKEHWKIFYEGTQ